MARPAKFTEATAQTMLDYLAENPDIKAALYAATGGEITNSRTFLRWLERAEAGDPKYMVSWPRGTPPRSFSEAYIAAREQSKILLDSTYRAEIQHGVEETLRNPQTGEPIWEIDEVALAQFESDKETARACGVFDPFYRHDPVTGGRVPVKVRRQVGAAQKIHGMRSLIPAQYNPSERREVDANVSAQVVVTGSINPDAPPPLQMIEGPMTPMRADLERRLAELRARGPQHAHPIGVERQLPPIPRARPDDPPEYVGRGGSVRAEDKAPLEPGRATPPTPLDPLQRDLAETGGRGMKVG